MFWLQSVTNWAFLWFVQIVIVFYLYIIDDGRKEVVSYTVKSFFNKFKEERK